MKRRKEITDDSTKKCIYCSSIIIDDNYLECEVCGGNVHILCLKHSSTPGDLLGDVFFDFTCANCMSSMKEASSVLSEETSIERFVRQNISWMIITALALYNLSIKSKGLSHHGYFHWRTHIVSFIDKNWNYLFEPNTRRRKKWVGTVSGVLSLHSPDIFSSGQEVFNENGWWKLTRENYTPRTIYNLYEQSKLKMRQYGRKERTQLDENSCSSDLSLPEVVEAKRFCHTDDHNGSCSRTRPYTMCKLKTENQINSLDNDSSQEQQSFNSVQSSLMDFLAENLGGDDLSVFSNLPNISPEPFVGGGKHDFLMSPTDANNIFDLPDLKLDSHASDFNFVANEQITLEQQISTINSSDLIKLSNDENDEVEEDEAYQPRIVQVTNFQQVEEMSNESGIESRNSCEIKKEPKTDDENNASDIENKCVQDNLMESSLPECKQSLFKKIPRRNWPWLVDQEATEREKEQMKENCELSTSESLTQMSLYEEQHIFRKLQKIFALEKQCKIEIPAYIRRFYRKLCVRKWKREHNRSIFTLDDYIYINSKKCLSASAKTQILDRYQLIAVSSKDAKKSFYARIAGSSEYEMFVSPYTQRGLHPFIFRSNNANPPWLKLMCEIQSKVTGHPHIRSPIDYCYIRPNHIAAVNALLQTAFWPGIDMSECLSYPDYSVVALYKKLVIGCGFLVPDVGYNEAYISFMAVRPYWQRSGIATFMLYHLIQTCITKDITLHVSATNPAIILYQKFGFKIEEFILDFYDKYLPINSVHSRHAFFLRLTR